MPKFARIEALPNGEAPLHIRQQWENLVVEVQRETHSNEVGYGVESGEKIDHFDGYHVGFREAVLVLLQAGKLPAALYWTDWLIGNNYNPLTHTLIFQQSELRVLETQERPHLEGEISWAMTLAVYDKLIAPKIAENQPWRKVVDAAR